MKTLFKFWYSLAYDQGLYSQLIDHRSIITLRLPIMLMLTFNYHNNYISSI